MDHLKTLPSSSQKSSQGPIAKPRGRPRKTPAASTLSAAAESSSSRLTRSQASKITVKYVPKAPTVRIDSPVDSESSISRPPSPVVQAAPVSIKRGPGRPKGSKNTKAASSMDNDPLHVRIPIRPTATEIPAVGALNNLASRLGEASEVTFLFAPSQNNIDSSFLYFASPLRLAYTV